MLNPCMKLHQEAYKIIFRRSWSAQHLPDTIASGCELLYLALESGSVIK